MSLAGNVSSKFSLYDQVGYLLVGSVLLLLITLDIWLAGRMEALPEFTLQSALVWAIVAYLMGHIVQAISNIFIPKYKDEFSDSDREVLNLSRDYFGFPDWNDHEAYQHAYILACGKDISGHVASVNAYYSLYRGWLILLSAETLFLIVWLGISWFSLQILGMVVGSLVAALVVNKRRLRYWDYARAKTLQTFVVVRVLDRNSNLPHIQKERKAMKFEASVHPMLSDSLRIIAHVREICNKSGKLLTTTLNSDPEKSTPFMETALQFTRLNYETIESTKQSIQEGYLAQSFVLLRWQLELVHLFYYLWRKPDEYARWSSGGKIKPKEIRQFLADEKLADWHSTYVEWCNFVHGNALAVENLYGMARTSPIDERQIAFAGHAYRNLMFLGHKASMVTLELLREVADVADFNPIAKAYMQTEKDVFNFSDRQNEWERSVMGLPPE